MTPPTPITRSPLAGYAAFLRDHLLDEITPTYLARCQALDVPLLRLFAQLSRDELLALSREGLATLLSDLEAGRALEAAAESLRLWERDELPGLPRDAVEPGDMVLLYAAQKQAMYAFLDRYATDVAAAAAVVVALDEHFTEVQNEALVVFDRLRRDAAARAVRAEAEREAAEAQAEELQALNEELQAQAEELQAQAEEMEAQQAELTRLNEALQRQNAQLDAEVARRTEDLQAINEELQAQAEELEAQQGELQDAHQALADQVRFQFEVMNNVPGAVGYCDLDLVIRAANEPYVALVGKPFAEVIGRHVREVFPPAAVPEIEALRDRIRATGKPERRIGEPGPPDAEGRPTWFDHVITPVRGRDGAVVGMLSLSTDVTDRIALAQAVEARSHDNERQKRLLERVTGMAPAGIAYLDRDLVVRWANPEILRLFNQTAATFVDRPVLEQATPEARERFGALLRGVLATGEPFHAAAMPYRVAGAPTPRESFWDISYVAVPGDDGRPEGVLLFALEASARVENERTQAERLDHFRAVDRLKDEFLAALSSQLASPINAVIGSASVLDEGAVGGPLRPEQQEYVRRILAMSAVQLALVNDLLDLGRHSAGMLTLACEPVDVPGAVGQVLEALAPLTAQQKQRVITYLPEGLPPATADPARLEQIVTNLVYAACKLTPPGGQIRVEVSLEGDRLRCEVQDAAPVLTSDQIGQALERFTQLAGTWLGLSVSKRLVEGHGGELGVTPRPGTGNAFWFTLPAAGEA